MIQIIPINNLPIFKLNDDLVSILTEKFNDIQENDVIVIAHTIISRIEGKEIDLNTINPSEMAKIIAQRADKDPRVVEVVLRESKTIVRMSDALIISETKHGFICANAGVDQSNATPNHVLTLPDDPDMSCKQIQEQIYKKLGKKVGVIISDTFGRVFRKGTTNIAIGTSGFSPIQSYKGKKDLFGYILKTTEVCIADELATAAGILMGQSDEGLPVILIRGLTLNIDLYNQHAIKEVTRTRTESLFW